MSDDLVERVALAIDSAICGGDQSSVAMELTSEEIKVLARAAIAVVLEEAARVADYKAGSLTQSRDTHAMVQGAMAEDIAAAIRAMVKEKGGQ